MNDNVNLHLYQIRKYPNLTYACFQPGHCADQFRMPPLQPLWRVKLLYKAYPSLLSILLPCKGISELMIY
jgi:hypothetical protein